jgi:hypothetical protein
MKQLIAIAAVVIFTSCGGASTETPTTDSTTVKTDTVKVDTTIITTVKAAK